MDISSSRRNRSKRRVSVGEEESSEEEDDNDIEGAFEEDTHRSLNGEKPKITPSTSPQGWDVTPQLLHEIPSPPRPPGPSTNGRKTSKVQFSIPTPPALSEVSPCGGAEGSSGFVECSSSEEATFLPRLGSLDVGVTAVEDVRTMNLEDHIVVLLPRTAEKLQCLLRPLRAHFLQGTHYSKPVVILTDVSLSQLEQYCNSLENPAETTRRAPDVAVPIAYDIYVVEGQTHKVADLRRAGIETAYTCLVLADRSSVQVR